MSVVIDFTYQDAEGNAVPGAAVELWTGDGGTGQSKVADFSDLGQGNYKASYDASGIYTIKVNGTAVPHMTSKYLPANDQLLQEHVDDSTLEFVDAGGGVYKLRVKAGGISASHLGAILGAGLTKDGAGKIVPDVDNETLQINTESEKLEIKANKTHSHNANEINISDEGGYTEASDVEAALQELFSKIGDINFEGFQYLGSEVSNNAGAIKNLATQVYANTKMITNGTDIYNRRTIYSDIATVEASGSSVTISDLPEYVESGTDRKEKICGYFVKRPGDKYIEINFQAKGDVYDEYGDIILSCYGDDKSVSIESNSYTSYSIKIDISGADDNTLQGYGIGMMASVNLSAIRMRLVNVDILGA